MYYILKDIHVDTDDRRVLRGDQTIALSDLSFDVFTKLLEAAPEPVSNADFSQNVWKTGHVSGETIAQRITIIRKALGDTSKDAQYIRTVRGAGYAVAGSVQCKAAVKLAGKTNGRGLTLKLYAVAALLFITIAATLLLGTYRDNVAEQAGVSPKSSTAIMIERAQTNLSVRQLRETNRSIAMLREVLLQDPQNFEARLTLSFALTTKATKFDGGIDEKREAETIARALTKEQPENSNTWSALAYSLGAQGRTNESLPAYQHAYQLDPNNSAAISSAAYEHLVLGNFYEALKLEMRARAAGGSSRYAEIQIAQSLELIDHPAAQFWHGRALSLNPNQVVILSELAKSHLRGGDPLAAEQILSMAEGEDQRAPRILHLMGRAALMRGDFHAARDLMNAAGEGALMDLAALNAVMGDKQLANQFMSTEKLLDYSSDLWPGTHVHLAEIAAACQRESDAIGHLINAVNLGWRDIRWLKQSPFLGPVMETRDGEQLISRISREIEAQRRLIEMDKSLVSLVSG